VNTPDLRPLGVGEILDRAVTLFVQRFAPLVLILAIVQAPLALLQFVVQPNTADVFGNIQKLLSLPPGHSAEQRVILEHLSSGGASSPATVGLLFAIIIFSVFATTACMLGAARAYTGAMPPVRELFRESLRRWLPQIATMLIFIGVFIGLFIALFVVTLVLTFSISALYAVSTIAALVIGIPLSLVAFAALMALSLLLYLALQLAFVSIAIEEPNPARAVARGFGRAFARPLLLRSLLVGFILTLVVGVGSIVITALAGVLAVTTHLTPLYTIVSVIGSVLLNALIVTFVVVYSYDVRVRREGYDLHAALATP